MSTEPDSTAESLMRPVAWIAVVLACVAGFVDALAYAELGKVMVAHVSGDTATMSVYATRRQWSQAVNRLLPILGFFFGVLVGRAASDLARRRGVRRRLSATLAIELAFFGAFAALRTPTPSLAILSIAAAMGTQSAALRHVAGHDIRTTFVTGMIVALADELFEALFRGRRERRRVALLHASVWAAFALGALGGGFAWLGWGAGSFKLAAGTLALLVVFDLIAPTAAMP